MGGTAMLVAAREKGGDEDEEEEGVEIHEERTKKRRRRMRRRWRAQSPRPQTRVGSSGFETSDQDSSPPYVGADDHF